MVDRRYAEAASGLHKVAGRTRALLESLVTFIAAESSETLRRLPLWQSGDDEGGLAAPDISEAQAERPPCLALFGEFSAGKSSLANLLIGTDMLPTSVLSTTRLPTRLRYADALEITTVADDGKRRHVSPDQVKSLSRDHVRTVEIGLPSPVLRKVEILDTSGFADPYHDPLLTLDVADQAGLAIWCTLASQAWRQTEQFTWKNLPEQLQSKGLLVVTHVDQLREETDRTQLKARLQHEAGPWFQEILLLSVPDAARAHGPSMDEALWQTSGGAAFFAALDKILASATKEQRQPAAAGPVQMPSARPAPSSTGPSPAAHDGDVACAPHPTDVERMLAQALSAIPDCLLAAYVDLDSRRPLAVKAARPTSPTLHDQVAAMTTALLQGEPLETIRKLIEGERGVAPEDRDEFQEMTIQTKDRVYLLLRQLSRPDRAAVVVCARRANVSLALLKLRRGLAVLDRERSGKRMIAAQ